MSIKEKLVELALSPLTSAVDIKFSGNVDAETIYQKDRPIQYPKRKVKKVRKVKNRRVRVNTGSTMAFRITDEESGEVRAIVVEDYRRRRGREWARVQEAHRNEDGSITKTKLTDLDQRYPEIHIENIGKFSWKGK